MNNFVLTATNSPLTGEQADLLNRLIPTLVDGQGEWISGYLTACINARKGEAFSERSGDSRIDPPAAAAQELPGGVGAEVTLLYGSQTGNSQWLAEETGRRLEAAGHRVTISSMARYKVRKLKDVSNLLVFVSTQGDGVPPDNAMLFHEELHSRKAPSLEGTRYSVLSLGDISYDDFCIVGQQFDTRLAELGATSLLPRADCDLDFQEASELWMNGILAALAPDRTTSRSDRSGAANVVSSLRSLGAPGTATAAVVGPSSPSAAAAFSRFNPFGAEILENITLNGRGSDKQTQHLEILLEGSNLTFEPGDSIGIYPQNHGDVVDELIGMMGWSPDEIVPAERGAERPIRDALINTYEITVLTRPLLDAVAAFSRDGLRELVKPENDLKLREYLQGRDLRDVVADFSLHGAPARDFVGALRRIPPRLYSIASSQRANPDTVHLAVVAVRYHSAGRDRKGVFSVHCAETLEPGHRLPLYVNSNPNFRMPADTSVPVIMIGPGTGVAPFRAFLEEREELGADGKTWLFYGDRRFRTDFLYQVDWQRWLSEGVLTHLDVAFSRDGERKTYVQDRMKEHSRELYSWIEQGAHIYVCGDEKRMAPDVHATLEEIISDEGGVSRERASQMLSEMLEESRYARDVY